MAAQPSEVSQRMSLPSSLALARTRLSGRHEREVMRAWCSARVKRMVPVSGSQRWRPPLRSPVASLEPSGLNAAAVTQSVCLRMVWRSWPLAEEKMRTDLSELPQAMRERSGLRSAARMASGEEETMVARRVPLRILKRTAWPEWAARPPAARRSEPSREKRRTLGCRSGKGRKPERESVEVL